VVTLVGKSDRIKFLLRYFLFIHHCFASATLTSRYRLSNRLYWQTGGYFQYSMQIEILYIWTKDKHDSMHEPVRLPS